MRLRGFHGEFYYADVKPFALPDGIYLAVCLGLIALFRFVNVAALVGGVVVG